MSYCRCGPWFLSGCRNLALAPTLQQHLSARFPLEAAAQRYAALAGLAADAVRAASAATTAAPTRAAARLGRHRPVAPVRPGVLQRRQDYLRRLGPGDRELLIEHEGRHAGDPDLRRDRLVGAHIDAMVIPGQYLIHHIRGEPTLHRELAQHRMVADRRPLGEPAAHDRLGDGILHTGRSSGVQEAVGVIRIAWHQRLPLEIQAHARRGERQLFLLGNHLLARDAILAGHLIHHGFVADGWRGAIQFVAVPDQFDLIGVLELAQGKLKMPPAEVAERAYQIGPDVDTHRTTIRRSRYAARSSTRPYRGGCRLSVATIRVPKVSTALYRRYRPDTFADVIGQEHVTVPLMRALDSGRIGHAYLFSGPRGCGKTTSARILARCLNCEQGPTGTPCGVCDSCVALARGGPGSIDVIEIDAASHGGVDDARDLRERAAFAPAESRFKVYIIDEAHMVTTQGFNALLKLVEEPPEHVKFIFATTEPEKVIGTIRSRTHHYPFRLVPPLRLQAYLEQLCEAEGVAVEPGVLSFVVRAGGGSVRDSLSVLDQLIGGSDERGLTYEGAAALLGFTDNELLDATITAFGAADGAEVFRQIDKVVETGHDPRRFVEDLLERFRDLIVLTAVPDAGASVLRSLPSDQIDRMRVQAGAFGPGALSRAADIVNAGLTEMTGATAPRLQLELIAARVLLPAAAGESGYAARLDRLERRLEVGGVPTGAPGDQSSPSSFAAGSPVAGGGPVAGAGPGAPDADGSAAGRTVQEGVRPTSNRPAVDRPAVDRPTAERPVTDRPVADRAGADRGGADRLGHQARDEGARGGEPRGAHPAEAEQPGGADRAGGPSNVQASPPQARPAGPRPRISMGPSPETVAGPATDAPPKGPGGLDVHALRRAWPDVLARIYTLKRTTWTFLSDHAQIQEYDGHKLTLAIGTTGLTNTFRAGIHSEIVRQALIDVLGVDARVEGVTGQVPGGSGGPGAGGPGYSAGGPVSSGGQTTGAGGSATGGNAPSGRSAPPADDWAELAPPPDDWGAEQPPVDGPPDARPAIVRQTSGSPGPGQRATGPEASEPQATAGRAPAPQGPARAASDGALGDEGLRRAAAQDWSDPGTGWGNAPTSGAPAWATQADSATTNGAPGNGSDVNASGSPSPSRSGPGSGTRAGSAPGSDDRAPGADGPGERRQGRNDTPATRPGPAQATPAGGPDTLSRAQSSPDLAALADSPYAGMADEDLVGDDDEDLADLGEVGQPVVERVLGGTVIWREATDD